MKKLKLKYNGGVIDEIEPGTTLYEISKRVKDDFEYEIVGANLDSNFTGLNVEVNENGTVEFFDTSSRLGNRIYSRSLEYLLTLAIKRLFGKECDVIINYSIDNGIHCEIEGRKITSATINKIEEEMRKIVKEKIPFNSILVDRIEAIRYLKRMKQVDKADTIKYLTDDTIKLHQIEDAYDYYYGPLVPHTGVLDKFSLIYIKDNSFILVYPTSDEPNKVKKYKERPLTSKTYKDFIEWSKVVGIPTISQLNEIIARGQGEAVVRFYEAHYNEEISTVIENVYKRKDKIKVILLAGPSSSGKTTTSLKLGLYLRVKGIRFKKISLDDYFVDRKLTPKDKNGNYDYSDINAVDIKLFQKHLKQLLKGEKVLMPTYDFVNGKKIYRDNYIKLDEGDMLIIEGIHTLNEKLTECIPREEKFKIFQSPLSGLRIDNHNRLHATDIRKIRRIVRDNTYRGTGAEETLAMWSNVDKEAEKNIYPYQDDADAIINSSLGYELNVLRIHAEPLLFGIDVESEMYPEAKRLLNLLRNFLTVSSELVPRDSILREFIGGSIFKEYKEK